MTHAGDGGAKDGWQRLFLHGLQLEHLAIPILSALGADPMRQFRCFAMGTWRRIHFVEANVGATATGLGM